MTKKVLSNWERNMEILHKENHVFNLNGQDCISLNRIEEYSMKEDVINFIERETEEHNFSNKDYDALVVELCTYVRDLQFEELNDWNLYTELLEDCETFQKNYL